MMRELSPFWIRLSTPTMMRELCPFWISLSTPTTDFFPTYQQGRTPQLAKQGSVANHLQNVESEFPGKHTGQEVIHHLFILITMWALGWIWKVSCARRTAVQHLPWATSHKMKRHLPGPSISKSFPMEETLICCLSGVLTISWEMWNLRVLRTRFQGHLRKKIPKQYTFRNHNYSQCTLDIRNPGLTSEGPKHCPFGSQSKHTRSKIGYSLDMNPSIGAK